MSKSTTAVRAAEKAKRKARDEVRVKIAAAAYKIEEALHDLIESKATELGVDATDLRSRFMLYANARTTAYKATVWNGLVHIKSKEWADKKADYQGSAFIGYVVERIHEDNLYDIDNMSQEENVITRFGKGYYPAGGRCAPPAPLAAGQC
ncbi:hypothetical protein BN14_09118 [Rhizoctonia solani AG-1 IB]|uniref:Uncharacterized protein n=1 Tax=Thanatephorus cucumeris (strain AG1-IB / isolate 7/3/14) TaxID=1108050 RepID=M5C7F0_THACB|nr:hypothetical protein BN14_09118 [Rhizoctonia solani AG-1 IB]